MSVASWSGSLLAWEQELTALKARVGGVLGRRELRETGSAFLDGLLSGIDRKTGWLMSEQSGAARPYRMQSLWDEVTGMQIPCALRCGITWWSHWATPMVCSSLTKRGF